MPDPLSLLPFALAAAGGRVNGVEVQQLVSAGLTLLQRSAPLVRALAGRQSAIKIPPGPALVAAFAASEGRTAILLDPRGEPTSHAARLRETNVGALFAIAPFPESVRLSTLVALNDVPRSACVRTDDREQTVDLGSHYGLALHGERHVAGAEEDCLITWPSAQANAVAGPMTHRMLLQRARDEVVRLAIVPTDRVLSVVAGIEPAALVTAFLAPLLAGASVDIFPPETAFHQLVAHIRQCHITVLIAPSAVIAPVLGAGGPSSAAGGHGKGASPLRLSASLEDAALFVR